MDQMIRGYLPRPAFCRGYFGCTYRATRPFTSKSGSTGNANFGAKGADRSDVRRCPAVGTPDRDWNWPIYEYPIPSDWESGAFIVRFVPLEQEDIRDPANPNDPETAALFVGKNSCAHVRFKMGQRFDEQLHLPGPIAPTRKRPRPRSRRSRDHPLGRGLLADVARGARSRGAMNGRSGTL